MKILAAKDMGTLDITCKQNKQETGYRQLIPTLMSFSSMVCSTACSNSLYNSQILFPSATCKPAAVRARSKRFRAFEMPSGEHSRTEGSCTCMKFK